MKTKVILIDDDIALGSVLTLALEEAGFDVHYQTSLVAIQSLVQEFHPNIVVLDVEVGCANGIDAFDEIKLVAATLPVLFISSHTDPAYVKRAINANGVAYLKKPFSPDELIAYINRFTRPENIEEKVSLGDSSINWKARLFTAASGEVFRLTPLDIRLLKLFAANLGKLLLREQLEAVLQEEDGYSVSASQTLNNYILRLRKYFTSDSRVAIRTIPRKGYQMVLQ